MPKRRTYGRTYSAALDEGVPTEDEWKDMTSYQTFVVADDEEKDHIFRKGDVALLLPSFANPGQDEDMDENELWVAKIRDIRSRNNEDVWVRVQWYYSADDVAAVIKSLYVSLSDPHVDTFISYLVKHICAENTNVSFLITWTSSMLTASAG